jgi:hypothetical protein
MLSLPFSSDQEKNNSTILMQSIESWNKGDLDSYINVYDTNVLLHGVPGVEPGKALEKALSGISGSLLGSFSRCANIS